MMNDCTDATPRDRRNRWRYTWLLALWAAIFVGGSFVLARDLVTQPPWTWLVALLPTAFAATAVAAYWHFLRHADELARAIELRSLALAVAGGFIVWPAVTLLETAGLPSGATLDLTVLVMIGCYVFGNIKGVRDYR